MKLVPKRRFAGFTNEWNKQRFGDVLRSHAFNEFLAKPVEYGSFEVIQQGDAPIVGYADGNPYKGFEDIVLFGDHTLSLYKPTRPFFLATDGVKILSGDNIDGSFLYTLIERYKPESQGYKRHFTILKDQICMLTSDREEQQKIGSFFKKLDERIAMQESKVEKLKAMKSAYLNEMFPAEGESVPKRRFAGFTDFWEQRRLGDLGDTFTGLSGKTKEDFGKGDAEFIPYLNVLNNPISDITFTEKVEVDKKQNEVMFGDIFFTTSSETAEEVGMSSVWLDDRKNVYLNSFCFGYRVRDNLDPFYMAYALRSFPVRKQLILLAQGISRYNISKRKAMDVRIHLPQLEEQKAIGSFFKKLDERIAMQEAKVEKLKAMKSAYLNEMFV